MYYVEVSLLINAGWEYLTTLWLWMMIINNKVTAKIATVASFFFLFGSGNKSYWFYPHHRGTLYDLEAALQIYGNSKQLKLSTLGTLDCRESFCATQLLLVDIGIPSELSLNHVSCALVSIIMVGTDLELFQQGKETYTFSCIQHCISQSVLQITYTKCC